MTNWSTISCAELISSKILQIEDGNHGEYRPRPGEFIENGIPYIRAADLAFGRVDFAQAGKISNDARLRIRKGIGKPGDVLLSHKGTVGRVSLVPKDAPPFVCSPQTTFWRSTDQSVLNSDYLAYLMTSPMFSKQLNSCKSESDMAPYVSLTQQKRFVLTLPPASEQESIVSVLNALDSKIAANREIARLASELTEALMKSMPQSSVSVALSSTAQFINGKAFTKDATGCGRIVIRIAELNSGVGASTVYTDAKVADQHIARPGDILFAWSGSLTLHRWYRPDAIINQHIFKVIPNEGIPSWLSFYLIKQKLQSFKAIAADKATTMGHIQRRHLDEHVLVPTRESTERWDPMLSKLWQRSLVAEQENETLSSLKSSLLPGLVSGELRVSKVER